MKVEKMPLITKHQILTVRIQNKKGYTLNESKQSHQTNTNELFT